jgi:hypothetical protein
MEKPRKCVQGPGGASDADDWKQVSARRTDIVFIAVADFHPAWIGFWRDGSSVHRSRRKTVWFRGTEYAEFRLFFGAALGAFALVIILRKTDSLRAAKSAESRLFFGAALGAFALVIIPRKTDSLRAARSAESRLFFGAALGAFALVIKLCHTG